MKPITSDEIRSIGEYEAVREDMRKRIIALKKYRRILLGDSVAMVFENRETMMWQIHEMMRVEGITSRDALEHECQTYSALLPDANALSATLFIELPNDTNIREALDGLIGIDEATSMWIGDDEVKASFDPGQYSEDRISSVHYIRFVLTETTRQGFLELDVPVRIRIQHPAYQAEAVLEGEARRSLMQDLVG